MRTHPERILEAIVKAGYHAISSFHYSMAFKKKSFMVFLAPTSLDRACDCSNTPALRGRKPTT